MSLSEERALVRDLAGQVAVIAASDENQRICQRWRNVNALRPTDRAPVWCRPVGAWAELLPGSALQCQDPWLRGLESGFRQLLIKHQIGDDEPVSGEFAVGAVFRVDPPNCWGVDIGRHYSGTAGGAWAYDPPLRTAADFERLRLPSFAFDRAATDAAAARAADLLGDLLPVRVVAGPPLHSILCSYAAELRGLTEMMMDTIAEPELLHRLMAYLRDTVMRGMDAVETSGMVTPNHTGPMTESDPLGRPGPDGRYSWQNCWCCTNSQEFDQVGPAAWEEFLLNYQKPILARFGLTGYGCCENLTTKIDRVLTIPNLRLFVCSAWTNLDRVIERCGDRYCIMWRQKASAVVFPEDLGSLEHDLDEGLRRLRGCHVQVVLRELQTLAGHPRRLHDWTRLAIAAAEKYA